MIISNHPKQITIAIGILPAQIKITLLNLLYLKQIWNNNPKPSRTKFKQDACSGVHTGPAVGKIPSQYSKK
jgi:hypothetical protein